MRIFLAPHNDDEALFSSYLIQRVRPVVVVICMDGNQHERKGLCTVEERREESRQAAKILGVTVEFMGISDDIPLEEMRQQLRQGFWKAEENFGPDDSLVFFVPRKDGGNPQHDLVSDVATDMLQECLYYGTYSKERLFPAGEMEIVPTPTEIALKEQALACYTSQLRINPHHFEAVKGKSEYLSFAQC